VAVAAAVASSGAPLQLQLNAFAVVVGAAPQQLDAKLTLDVCIVVVQVAPNGVLCVSFAVGMGTNAREVATSERA